MSKENATKNAISSSGKNFQRLASIIKEVDARYPSSNKAVHLNTCCKSPVPCSADLSPEQVELAEKLGSFLWESSTLRHGLFTPPEFSRLVKSRIKQFFYEHNSDCPDTGEAR